MIKFIEKDKYNVEGKIVDIKVLTEKARELFFEDNCNDFEIDNYNIDYNQIDFDYQIKDTKDLNDTMGL
jgi:hypothetical protein